MNRLAIALSVLWGLGGCSAQPATIDTSGSHPSLGKTAPMTPEAKEAEVDTGRLLVLTPRTPEGNCTCSGYTVYTEDGHKVAHEVNLGPVERRLAPGRYFVRLDENVPGRDFWVRIEKGRVTRVESGLWNGSPATVK